MSSGFAFVMLITELYFVIGTMLGLIYFLTIYAVQFMNPVMELNFFAILWIGQVNSSHYYFVFIINFEN